METQLTLADANIKIKKLFWIIKMAL